MRHPRLILSLALLAGLLLCGCQPEGMSNEEKYKLRDQYAEGQAKVAEFEDTIAWKKTQLERLARLREKYPLDPKLNEHVDEAVDIIEADKRKVEELRQELKKMARVYHEQTGESIKDEP